jgi:hypothetical protein
MRDVETQQGLLHLVTKTWDSFDAVAFPSSSEWNQTSVKHRTMFVGVGLVLVDWVGRHHEAGSILVSQFSMTNAMLRAVCHRTGGTERAAFVLGSDG